MDRSQDSSSNLGPEPRFKSGGKRTRDALDARRERPEDRADGDGERVRLHRVAVVREALQKNLFYKFPKNTFFKIKNLLLLFVIRNIRIV